MSITDELRRALGRIRIMAEEQDGCSTLYYISPTVDELTAIADRIDEQHCKALERVAAMVDEPDELDGLDKRIKALEHLADGMLLAESEMEERVEAIERKLNHRGER